MRDKILIIGAGITGITLAERFASKGNRVLVIEKRNHIGGNCYDFKNKGGILVHKYGPHIFHTNYKEVWDYLSKFTNWIPYEHKVLGYFDGIFAPIPFNLNTISILLPKKSDFFKDILIQRFGLGSKITILELMRTKDKDLKFLAKFIYKKIYYGYSKKQWGKLPEKMDSSVTGRVPLVISYDDRYFQDKYQGIPKEGYTKMFEKMLQNKNIEVKLNTDYKKIKNKVQFDTMFYTGPIDEFFDYKYGKLQYRYFKMQLKRIDKKEYQPVAVVNYPSLKYKFTRITEFKKLTQQNKKTTIIGLEYPGEKGVPAWPVLTNDNISIFGKYWQEAEKLKKSNIYFIGRLAEFKYYNMDQAVKNALQLTSFLI